MRLIGSYLVIGLGVGLGGCGGADAISASRDTEASRAASTTPRDTEEPRTGNLLAGESYCGTARRETFEVGAPVPSVVVDFGGNVGEVALTGGVNDTVNGELQALEQSLPLPPGSELCVVPARPIEEWAYGRIVHVRSFYVKPAAEPASAPNN
jgi:hypothetical protein